MPSLRELQLDVMAALLDGAAERATQSIVASGVAASRRLEVYANTARTNFIGSLTSSYPVITRLVGEPYFRQCAREFHGLQPSRRLEVYANTARTNFIGSLTSSYPVITRLVGEPYFRQCAREFHGLQPSRCGDLQPAGTLFADYLAQRHRDGEYRYLGEVARLEWLCQETLLAAEHAPLDVARLARVPATAYDDLRFRLHPSVRLFASEFPCLRIWQVNT